MRDENEQPSDDGREAGARARSCEASDTSATSTITGDGSKPTTLLAAAELRELLAAHPVLGDVTLAELFFDHSGQSTGSG